MRSNGDYRLHGVAVVLAAPVKAPEGIGAINTDTREATGGCRFESQFGGERVELEVVSTVNKRQDAFGLARRAAQNTWRYPASVKMRTQSSTDPW